MILDDFRKSRSDAHLDEKSSHLTKNSPKAAQEAPYRQASGPAFFLSQGVIGTGQGVIRSPTPGPRSPRARPFKSKIISISISGVIRDFPEGGRSYLTPDIDDTSGFAFVSSYSEYITDALKASLCTNIWPIRSQACLLSLVLSFFFRRKKEQTTSLRPAETTGQTARRPAGTPSPEAAEQVEARRSKKSTRGTTSQTRVKKKRGQSRAPIE